MARINPISHLLCSSNLMFYFGISPGFYCKMQTTKRRNHKTIFPPYHPSPNDIHNYYVCGNPQPCNFTHSRSRKSLSIEYVCVRAWDDSEPSTEVTFDGFSIRNMMDRVPARATAHRSPICAIMPKQSFVNGWQSMCVQLY